MTNRREIADVLLNLLLEWGRTSLQTEKFPGYLADIQQKINSWENIKSDILQEIATSIIQDSTAARERISCIKIVDYTPEDLEWTDVLDSLAAFDKIIFLLEALMGNGSPIDTTLTVSAAKALSDEEDKINTLFFSDHFSCLRLTPYNAYRRNRIQSIEEPSRYLFPWQDIFSDEPLSLIFDLSEHYHHLENPPAQRRLPDYLRKNSQLYLAELARDTQLHECIKEQNHVVCSLEKTVQVHWALRLWNAVRRAGIKHLLPEIVEKIGLVQVSREVFQKQEKTPDSQLVMDVIQACYEPGIDEPRRLDLLLQLEDRVKDAQKFDTANEYLNFLIKLSKNELNADNAAESLLDFWFERLNMAAELMLASQKCSVKAAETATPYQLLESAQDWFKDKVLWLSELWEPQWAGEMVTAADIPEQNRIFVTEEGKIKISCIWGPSQNDEPAYIQISWQADISVPCQIWMRFLDPGSEIEYANVCLGSELEGESIFTSNQIGFEPSRQRWAVKIFFTTV